MYQPLANGYHPIQSVFQLISLADELYIRKRERGFFSLTCDDQKVPVDHRNTIRSAYDLLSDDLDFGVEIVLKKRIPLGGGLGGGSSNAAAFIRWVIQQVGVTISLEKITIVALKVGADVPFFLGARTAWVEGVGEKITPIPSAPYSHYVLIFPAIHSDTRSAYQALDQAGVLEPLQTHQRAIPSMDDYLDKNDFQMLLFAQYPRLADIATHIPHIHLTGSGATLFIPCLGPAELQDAVSACETYLADEQYVVVEGAGFEPT